MTCRMYSSVSGGTMWKPPMTAWTFWMPEAACACLIVLMTSRWLQDVSTTSPLPLTTKFVPISCSKSSGMKLPVFFADETFSGKHPKPLTTPIFSRLGRSGVSRRGSEVRNILNADLSQGIEPRQGHRRNQEEGNGMPKLRISRSNGDQYIVLPQRDA